MSKTQTLDLKEFESPLKRYQRVFCEKCQDAGKECNLTTENGLDRVFLCMNAASLRAVFSLETNPLKILQEAEKLITAYEQNPNRTPAT